MKTLYLLRHAKSSWDHPGLRDHERPLSDRGRWAAPAMGAHMAAQAWVPDLVLCSDSVRTRETWALVEAALGPVPVEYDAALYGASAGELFRIVQDADDQADSILLVSHNPGTENLAIALAGEGDPDLIQRLAIKYPTAALAVLETGVERWEEVETQGFRLVDFVRPRDLELDGG